MGIVEESVIFESSDSFWYLHAGPYRLQTLKQDLPRISQTGTISEWKIFKAS